MSPFLARHAHVYWMMRTIKSAVCDARESENASPTLLDKNDMFKLQDRHQIKCTHRRGLFSWAKIFRQEAPSASHTKEEIHFYDKVFRIPAMSRRPHETKVKLGRVKLGQHFEPYSWDYRKTFAGEIMPSKTGGKGKTKSRVLEVK